MNRSSSHFAWLGRRLALLAAFLVASYPLFWMVLTSFRLEQDARRHPFALLFQPTLANLEAVFSSGLFARAYMNSAIVAVLGVFLAVTFAAWAAFAFAHCRFRGRQTLFVLFLLGMMIPIHVTLVPLNQLLGPGGLRLKGTLWALIGPYVGFALPISILILRGAFEAVPKELLEAARMDGCNAWGTFRYVGLPLVRPALATVVIFNALTMWNEFAFALTLLGPKSPTLPLAITQFQAQGENANDLALTCAALTVSVLPLLVVYFLAQKHIIRGLTAGAVKQ
jgi:raffinose/stachyose/melibiose transport system permease protein